MKLRKGIFFLIYLERCCFILEAYLHMHEVITHVQDKEPKWYEEQVMVTLHYNMQCMIIDV